MYYLALLIDNRKYHVAHLYPADSIPTGIVMPSFVLEHQAGQGRLLLSIVRQAKLICRGGYSFDRWLDWSSLTVDYSGSGLTLHMRTSHEASVINDLAAPLPSVPDAFKLMKTPNRYELTAGRRYIASSLVVTLSIEVDETIYESKMLIHLVPQGQIFDVVMDFGSEASQIVTYRRGGNAIISRVKMVDNLIDYYYPDLAGKDLHQRVSDKELYRSAFFIKKEGSVFDPNAKPGINGNNEFLNLLTAKDEKNRLTAERILVSNLKLAHLGAYNFTVKFASKDPKINAFGALQHTFQDTIVKLQQAVINYFMQTVLEEIRRSTRDSQPLYMNVKLLVPNVFEQNKVAKLALGTKKGLDEIAEKYPDFKLNGVEVSTISESDAAFLGFKREQDDLVRQGNASFFEQSGRYLIIDAGKGTTDFSILEINPTTYQLSSLYRSGFIGAGNILSYAFIDTVFTSICGIDDEERKRAIYAVTKRADIADKLQFTEVIEKLKHSYDPTRNYQPLQEVVDFATVRSQLFDANEPGTLGTIANLLEQVWQQQGSIRDEWQIINRTVNEIANRIHREVIQSGRYADLEKGEVLVKKIILTGRGFLFEPLRKAISQAFDIQTLKTDDLKKVCLSGAFSSDHINYESNLVGFPDVYQLFGRIGKQSKQIDTGNGVLLDIPIYSRVKRWLADKSKSWQDVKDAYGDEHLVSAIQISSAENTPLSDEPSELSAEEEFLNHGKVFPNYNRNAKVVTICGLDYKKHHINSPTVNVFFTGDDFIIRDATTYSRLQVEPEFFRQTQLVSQTLYPFADISLPADVRVMPLTDSF
ncbi:hypothetical protein [Spirosoma litoris]